ncbi:hypothetical protein A2U01_0075657, partial [Trifolium medium]|nr:hypothetical protein [Trifolium medium]
MSSSGIDHLVDVDGEFVPDSLPDFEGEDARKEGEAKILLGIQKEVGFTFAIDDVEIQNKLVELENIDREKNDVREQVR